MELSTLQDVHNLRGKRVLLRLDLNVPLANGEASDTYRIERVRKTLEFLKKNGARTLLVSHIEGKGGDTLAPVAMYLSQMLPLSFAETLPEAQAKLAEAKEGTFVLLENLRNWEGEKKNDRAFAQELAAFAELYVNDAFSASHREHASIIGVPRLLPSYAGFLFAEEVAHLSRALSPAHPALVIIGGAKFETKLPLVRKFLRIADTVYVCGALANDVYKARGYEVGRSLVSDSVLEAGLIENPKLQVPSDVVVESGARSEEKGSDAVAPGEKIVDAGGGALSDIRALIEGAKFVLWNGPLGEYEVGFDAGTIAAAQALAESDAESIIGGGDLLAVVSRQNLFERFSFVSTGGGAMLQFLAEGTLPGLEALRATY